MNRLTTLALLSALLGIFSIQSVFAGPFSIDMGMSLAEVKAVCKTTPKHIQDNVYEITPPKTNDMFETYSVRIDPDYGVYWLKAIGKDLYTNGYGDRVKSTFESLVESIRRTYGEESYRVDELKEGSLWGEPKDFMYALKQEDRKLLAIWSKSDDDIVHKIQAASEWLHALNELLSDPDYRDRTLNSDSIALNGLINERISQLKKLPSDIAGIVVYAKALSTSLGCVCLEYSFSNDAAVEAKADSVF